MTTATLLRLSGDCPTCSKPLVLRRARQGGDPFIGCTGYPACCFTEKFDAHLQDVLGRLDAMERECAALRQRMSTMEAARRGTADADACEPLRKQLIRLAHPDKWSQGQPASVLAHEVMVMVNKARSSRHNPKKEAR
jgi:ssDNA-binding Zn-finger/Zn-ribbon topoisomerase 1